MTGSALADGDYSWRVQGSNASGDGPASSTLSFTVSTAIDLLEEPFAIDPWGSIRTTTPTYLWMSVPGATQYQLRIERGSEIIHDATYARDAACDYGLCEVGTGPAPVLAGGSYSWAVRGLAGGVQGPWSEASRFHVRVTLVRPTLLAPGGTIYTRQPTYRWKVVEGATGSAIRVDGQGTRFTRAFGADQVCSAGICEFSAGPELRKGRHRWYVRATADGSKSRPARKTFRVR